MGYFDDKPANIDDKGWQLIKNAKNVIEKDKSFPNRDCLIETAMNAMYDYFAKCKIDVSKKIEEICSEFGVQTIHLGINQELKQGYFQNFTIVRIILEDGTHRNYLVDCTYRQFFTKSKSNLKRIGVVRLYSKGASIGAYMIKTKRRKEIANSLISRGYVEINPEVIKEYFDAIVFSGRDKEYYTKHGLDYMKDDDIVPEYTAKDYIKMILDMIMEEEKTMASIANEL